MPKIKPDYVLPWERQPEEGDEAWEAFVVYRDMPHTRDPEEERKRGARSYNRSQRAVAAQLGKSRTLMDRWAQRHHWADRCRAWDAEVDRDRRSKLRSQALAAANEHANLATGLITAISMPLRALLKPQLQFDDNGQVLRNEDGKPITRDRTLDLEAMRSPELLLLLRQVAALLPSAIAIRTEALGNPNEPLPEPPEWAAEQDVDQVPVTIDRMLKLLEAAGEAGLLDGAGPTPSAVEAAIAEAAGLAEATT